MESETILRARLGAVHTILAPLWPEARPLLHYRTCFELLCAVVLSAQCTDDQVNRVSPALFALWPDAASLSKAAVAEVEGCIHSVGFFHTKARHLVGLSAMIEADFGGEVPRTMESLLGLPGVGRKTANLVLSACFGEPGIIVDTHVLRVMRRLGFGDKRGPEAMEASIAALVPRDAWTAFSHAVNRHGKNVCDARKPACQGGGGSAACPLGGLCPRQGLPSVNKD